MNDIKCANCKFFEPINHRGQRYPKGKCLQHGARRISDGYEITLTITSPYEFVCDLHEPAPQPTYAFVDGNLFLVPPVVVKDLTDKGWVMVKMESDGKMTLRKDEKSDGKA